MAVFSACGWWRSRTWMVAGTLLAAGCSATDPPSVTFEEQDENGRRIILNHAPSVSAGRWQLTADPLVEIGQIEGDEPYLFRQIVHAQTASDGSVIVVDGGISRIRRYSPEGVHLGSTGGFGGGPGELQGVLRVQRMRGDTMIFTEPTGRFSVFEGDGRFVDTWTPEQRPGPFYFLTGDEFLWMLNPSVAPTDPGYHRTAQPAVRGNRGGIRNDTVAVLTWTSFVVPPNGSGAVPIPFATGDRHTVDPAGRLIISGEMYDLEFHSLGGIRDVYVRFANERYPISDSDWRNAIEESAEAAGRFPGLPPQLAAEFVRARREALEQAPKPTSLPRFDRLVIDTDGNVWAREVSPAGADAEVVHWKVIDPEGHWLTTVTTPAALDLLEVAGDRVVGRWTDELGVQKVRIYGLVKAS